MLDQGLEQTIDYFRQKLKIGLVLDNALNLTL